MECKKENIREDTFLDIPLPIRPFGKETSFGSVKEALEGFVAAETLDGANQSQAQQQVSLILVVESAMTANNIPSAFRVVFPEILDMNPLVSNSSNTKEEEPPKEEPENDKQSPEADGVTKNVEAEVSSGGDAKEESPTSVEVPPQEQVPSPAEAAPSPAETPSPAVFDSASPAEAPSPDEGAAAIPPSEASAENHEAPLVNGKTKVRILPIL
jgi:hypothetical protein